MVPAALELRARLELADGVGEPDVLDRMEGFADQNRPVRPPGLLRRRGRL